jgi:hypothetical protein
VVRKVPRVALGGPPFQQLLADLEYDASQLREISAALGIAPKSPLEERAAWIGEKLGRLKLNGHLIRRSPLSLVIELEGLQMAVRARVGNAAAPCSGPGSGFDLGPARTAQRSICVSACMRRRDISLKHVPRVRTAADPSASS